MSKHVSAFLESMAAAGVEPVEPIARALASGQPVRFQAKGDRKGRKNGWAMLHLDGIPAGAFGHWRMGIRSTWSARGSEAGLSLHDRRKMAANIRAMETKRQRQLAEQHREAAAQAVETWNAANRAEPAHPYLIRKRLQPIGIRQHGCELLVPMLDSDWRLWNLQRIRRDGYKLFGKGARTKGLCWHHGIADRTGQPSTGPIVIAEGFATAAAIHRATGHAVAAAMSARNLGTVATALRKAHSDRQFIIAADDDCHLAKNIGLEAARKAAESIGALLAVPHCPGARSRSAADFADLSDNEVRERIGEARHA